ncbi:hypothetical protein RB13214 [Rhodopirellula baltica SH 1]|uniref:Uncharacterized protein n=1 Tax=Rhodopirellula baltica (strain DSM 10527 / NCIMB 13988 / SH1) TaxID=243090 RepID=Q7UHG8_RHOBA|nr:hypothetical protein RB13214 [Rhodopirellula baltica SH 1]
MTGFDSVHPCTPLYCGLVINGRWLSLLGGDDCRRKS